MIPPAGSRRRDPPGRSSAGSGGAPIRGPAGQRSCKVPAISGVAVTGGEAGALRRPLVRHDTPLARTPPVEPSGTATRPSILRSPLGEVSRWQSIFCGSSVRSRPGHTLRAMRRRCASDGWQRNLVAVATTAATARNRRANAGQIRYDRLATAAGRAERGHRPKVLWFLYLGESVQCYVGEEKSFHEILDHRPNIGRMQSSQLRGGSSNA